MLTVSLPVLFCAKQGFPPGGPEDKTPPFVVKTIPLQKQTAMDLRTQATLWFSEPVKPSVSSSAVFISPYQGDNVRLKWKGERLKIFFLKPLRGNCTYVVTLGTAIQDYHNNHMSSSFTLAFSTGSVLDEGEISGNVYSSSGTTGLDVWAYKCEDKTDLDPTQQEPDYIVQCDEKGTFRFSNVAPVQYRLFAVRDRASDRIYQAGDDEIGVPYRDVLLSPDKSLQIDSCFFKMTREETGPPSLLKVTALDRNHLFLRFDRFLSPLTSPFPLLCNIIRSDRPLDTLGVKALFLNRDNARELFALTTDQSKDNPYTLSLRTDWIDNPPDSLFWISSFSGNGQPDTLKPKLVLALPKHRDRTFNPLDPIRLAFNETMDTTDFSKGFVLKDTSEKVVQGLLKWSDPTEVRFIPFESLMNYHDYIIRLSGAGVKDAGGNALPDSVIRFHTSTLDTLSEIAGAVRQADSAKTGDFCLTATQVENKEVVYSKRLISSGPYRVQNCLPGKYILECYRDLDGNGRYSYGKAFPFKPSEPFVVYKDTVKVRSRWPNEGNDLVLP